MKYIFVNILFFFSFFPLISLAQVVVKGKVTDAERQEALIGAAIRRKDALSVGVASSKKGTYRFVLPRSGEYVLQCSSLGFRMETRTINVTDSLVLNFVLQPMAEQLDEVVVRGQQQDPLRNALMGVGYFPMKKIAQLPTFLGENDVLKLIQLTPGVQAENDGSSGYQVRGGESTQNLILLDEAPINHAGHFLGLFPAFHAVALREAVLYKGHSPAQFGGRVSSVMDVRMKEGDFSHYSGSLSVGLLSAGGYINGPLIKGKSSFAFSVRRTYLDLLLKPFPTYESTILHFYDANLKANYSFSNRNKIFLSGFMGQDKIGVKKFADMDWLNQAATLRWWHSFNEGWVWNTSFIYSNYKSDNQVDLLTNRYAFQSSIREQGLKSEMKWRMKGSHMLRVGIHAFQQKIVSADWQRFNRREREERVGMDYAAWIQSDWDLTPHMNLLAGCRFSVFTAMGGNPYYRLNRQRDILETMHPSKMEVIKTYAQLEPRVALSYRWGEHKTLKISYNRMSQQVHTLKNPVTTAPFERYILSSNLIQPTIADQLSVGCVGQWKDKTYEWTIEGYYKWMKNELDYLDGKGFSTAIEIERLLASGKGKAYGLEMQLNRKKGPLTGWINYTLSWSKRKIADINEGRWYNANNDKRHDLAIVALYKLNKKWSFSANWVYTSGQALNAPSAKYSVDGETHYYYPDRNAYRAPAYHRLDLGAIYKMNPRKHYRGEWTFGLFNAYSHLNPYVVTIAADNDKPTGTKASMTSLYGIIPSVAYKIYF